MTDLKGSKGNSKICCHCVMLGCTVYRSVGFAMSQNTRSVQFFIQVRMREFTNHLCRLATDTTDSNGNKLDQLRSDNPQQNPAKAFRPGYIPQIDGCLANISGCITTDQNKRQHGQRYRLPTRPVKPHIKRAEHPREDV